MTFDLELLLIGEISIDTKLAGLLASALILACRSGLMYMDMQDLGPYS